jgi:hypothetical protein
LFNGLNGRSAEHKIHMDPEFASAAVTKPQVPLFHHPGGWEQESYDPRRGILVVINLHASGKRKSS